MPTTTGNLNLPTHLSGDTLGAMEIAITDGDGSPIDLTGAEVTLRVKRRKEDRRSQLVIGTDDGGLAIVDAVAGLVMIQKRTIELSPGIYHSEIEVAKAGETTIANQGTWTISPDVSR
ncbi:phage baseplate upper protein [Roseiconus lacunae]|uniref:phage baseplate upper protein n=1 Tax=Roseiconus lacunae TaxID=2605694 RepID=UPI001E304E88|nr:phage baseplate upper protein [Roseiconus lacunae]MCD0459963.1 phage baseplate upper protein [Roseiconus lacunae]